MSTQIIDTMTDEHSNLALHVQLCEQRYMQLLRKLDQQDLALTSINQALAAIHTSLNTETSSRLKYYLSWAGVVIVSLMGALITVLTR